MITDYCHNCGTGPMDLPGDFICETCRIELQDEDPATFEDDDDHE